MSDATVRMGEEEEEEKKLEHFRWISIEWTRGERMMASNLKHAQNAQKRTKKKKKWQKKGMVMDVHWKTYLASEQIVKSFTQWM